MLKRFIIVVIAAFFVWGSFVPLANASVITFDDLGVGIFNDYAGLNWSEFAVVNGNSYSANPSGYEAGIISPNNVAYNWLANDAKILAKNAFNFNSAYFTGAWNNGLNISVKGYLNGVEQYSDTLVVNSAKPLFVAFNWTNINSVVFSSFGGVNNPDYAGSGDHFVMDNVDISNVPVPAALPLFGFGLAGVSGLKARRRRKEKAVISV